MPRQKMKITRFCLLAFVIVPLAGCQLPSIEKAQSKFCREHPDATVLDVSEEITNRVHAQFHFYYMNPGDSQEHEEVWYYGKTPEAWVRGEPETVK